MINTIALNRFGKRIAAIDMLVVIFTPLQDWWNFFVYIRPRYVRCLSMYPMLSCRQRLGILLELQNPPSQKELHAMRIQHARSKKKKWRCKEPLAKETPNPAETDEKTSNLNLPDESESCSNNPSSASRSMVKLEQRNEENDANEVTAVATIIPVASNEPTKGDDDDDDLSILTNIDTIMDGHNKTHCLEY